MAETRKIQRALVSVFHKDGLEEILRTLHAQGVELLSTGGTQQFIEQLGIPCARVEDVTTYPSILGGRVKTLHPKIFGGILGRRALENDQKQMAQYDIPGIDLVIVNWTGDAGAMEEHSCSTGIVAFDPQYWQNSLSSGNSMPHLGQIIALPPFR